MSENEPKQIGPKVKQTNQIIGIDDPEDIQHILTMNGNILSVREVVRMIKKGRNFSVVDPDTHQITGVTYVDDNTIKTIGDETKGNNLKKLPTFNL